MSESQDFDVFLAHHSDDKPIVLFIANKLKEHQLKPWIDQEQIAPGSSFQDEIQSAILLVRSAAIFIGKTGLGKWQKSEIESLVTQCLEREIPVIPILLPGVDEVPKHLLFLRQRQWVNFKNQDDPQALELLIWGIRGTKQKLTSKESKIILRSKRGVNYIKLSNLLAEQKWKEANEETARIMLKVAGREEQGYLDDKSINEFPCEDLHIIDSLWVKYSQNHFGFSVQKNIWSINNEIYEQFSNEVGWRKGNWSIEYKEFCFCLNSPPGHLPALRNPDPNCNWQGLLGDTGAEGLKAFFRRMDDCEKTFIRRVWRAITDLFRRMGDCEKT